MLRSLLTIALALTVPAFAQTQTGNTGTTDNSANTTGGAPAPAATGDLSTTDVQVEFEGRSEGSTNLFGDQQGGLFEPADTGSASGRGSTRSFNANNGGRTSTTRAGGASSRTRQIRPQFRLGFVPSSFLSMVNVTARANQRFVKIAAQRSQLSGVSVASANVKGSVTLKGTVKSQSAKRLAAALLRLEPGVRKVKNELQVAAASAEPVVPAAPITAPQIRTRP